MKWSKIIAMFLSRTESRLLCDCLPVSTGLLDSVCWIQPFILIQGSEAQSVQAGREHGMMR